jgi:chemotaxis protein histidine kinase CheA
MHIRKFTRIALACIAPLFLSGCLILPGEFVADMTVKKSGDFSFSYKGKIQLLGLANLLNNSLDAVSEFSEFEATCWVDQEGAGPEAKAIEAELKDEKAADKKAKKIEAAEQKSVENAEKLTTILSDNKGSAATASAEEDPELAQEAPTEKDKAKSAEGEEKASDSLDAVDEAIEEDAELQERDCTKEEVAEQKADWDEKQAADKKMKEEQKKIFANLLGGIDPQDPATIKRFTKEVERLAAWNKVEHLGEGVFMIDYSTSGHLADDFAFPIIPRYALGEPMIHVTRWDNGRVRVEAPAFHTDPDLNALAMMSSSDLIAMSGMTGGKKAAKPIEIKGIFTLTTDARILANNTEEGPEQSGAMEVLRWDIGPANFGAPMALLKMVQ